MFSKKKPGSAAVSANAAYFLEGETFGVRQLAAAFENILEKRAHWAVFKSGSKLPHSEGALRAQKVCVISCLGGSLKKKMKRRRMPYILLGNCDCQQPAGETPALPGISTVG